MRGATSTNDMPTVDPEQRSDDRGLEDTPSVTLDTRSSSPLLLLIISIGRQHQADAKAAPIRVLAHDPGVHRRSQA